MLSIKFGYGRPAFFADAFAAAFFAGDSFLDFLLVFFVSHTGFFMVSPIGILIVLILHEHLTLQYRLRYFGYVYSDKV